jgi:hypothetical protein
VRRALLCECDDGRAAYVEYWRVGLRLWQTKEWIGPIGELGLPRPVPRGFEMARGLRLYLVREQSMVLSINGVDRIVAFTGEDPPKDEPLLRRLGLAAILLIPNAGTVVDWTITASRRLKPGSTRPAAIATASYWRTRLEHATPAQV